MGTELWLCVQPKCKESSEVWLSQITWHSFAPVLPNSTLLITGSKGKLSLSASPEVRIPENRSIQQGFTRSVLPLAVRFHALTQLLLTQPSFKFPALPWQRCPESFPFCTGEGHSCVWVLPKVLAHHLEMVLQQAEQAWLHP